MGLNILLGYVYTDENKEQIYECLWALTPEEEKAAFEGFMNFIIDRIKMIIEEQLKLLSKQLLLKYTLITHYKNKREFFDITQNNHNV